MEFSGVTLELIWQRVEARPFVLALLCCVIMLLLAKIWNSFKKPSNEDEYKDKNTAGAHENNTPLFPVTEDIIHHTKYFGTTARGKTQTFKNDPLEKSKGPYTPSPVDVVGLGIENLSYLVQFGEQSYFHHECQEALQAAMSEIESGLGRHSHLVVKPYTTKDAVDINVMLSKVNDTEFLTKLCSVSTPLRMDMLEQHLNTLGNKTEDKR